MKLLLMILLFVVQPVFWVGLLRECLDYFRRLKRTRHTFGTAVIAHNYEIRHFLLGTVVLGIVFSLVAWLTELILPFSWILAYESAILVSLLAVPWLTLSVTISVLVACVWLGTGSGSSVATGQNYVLFVSLVLLALSCFLMVNGGRFNVPRSFRNQRNTLVAGYPFKELTVIPFLVMVPGSAVQRCLPFLPTFNVAGHSVSLFLMPVLLGLRLTVFRHVPRFLFKRLGIRLMILAIIGIGLTFVDWRVPVLSGGSLLLLLALFWLIIALTKYTDLHHGRWFSQVVNGMRVVGVEPGTPASQMNLRAGDVILNVNRRRVLNENELYLALQSHPTYCRLRILNTNDRIVIAGSAIFNDVPHDVGIVSFRDSK